MKRCISILVIAAMLFALGMNMLTAYADSDMTLDTENNSSVTNAQEARRALGDALNRAKTLIFTDYTEETVAYLEDVMSKTEIIYADEDAEYDVLLEALTDIRNAIDALEAKEADISEIKLLYTKYKYSDTTKLFNQIEFQKAMDASEALFEKSQILISELESVELLWESVSSVSPIETAYDFLSMEKGGSYVLLADIILSESYGEFSGYLYGCGHTVTVDNTGVFESLNGASLLNLKIDGSIEGTSSVGALATNAFGEIFISDVVNGASVCIDAEDAYVSGFISNIKGADITFNGCVNNAEIKGGTAAGFCSFADSGVNNFYFYNCVNNGNIVGSAGAGSGFVANAYSKNTESIEFEYCAELGNISSQGSCGAFLGYGNGNVTIYGCVVGSETAIGINSALDGFAVGGVIGYLEGDFDINIDSCLFNIDVSSVNENAPTAHIVGACDGNVIINNTYAQGSVSARGNNIYKLSSVSIDSLIVEKLIIDISLATYTDADILDTIENTDFESLDIDSFNDVRYGIIAIVLTSKGTDAEKKIEAVELYSASLQMLKTVEEAELWNEKEKLTAYVEASIKDAELYTEESYMEYISDVNKLIDDIHSVVDIEALNEIDVEKALDSAELKLVKSEDFEKETKERELADARSLLLVILSAKRENAGDVFTQESYKEYLKAFDDIVAKINDATTLEELKKIDVALLKVNAENKLVIKVPEVLEEYHDGNAMIDDNDYSADEADNVNNENDTVTTQNSGCMSSVAMTAIAVVGVIGVAFVRKKKHN